MADFPDLSDEEKAKIRQLLKERESWGFFGHVVWKIMLLMGGFMVAAATFADQLKGFLVSWHHV